MYALNRRRLVCNLAKQMEAKEAREVPTTYIVTSHSLPHQREAKMTLRVLLYVLAASLIYSSNTLGAKRPGAGPAASIIVISISIILVLALFLNVALDLKQVARWFGWSALLSTYYVANLTVTNSEINSDIAAFFLLYIIFPLLIILLVSVSAFGFFLRAYVNLMTFLSIASLILWILGPILGVLSTNCVIENSWNGVPGLIQQTPGYYHLLYITQMSDASSILPNVIRNTGVFVEAPMYSFALILAVCFELFFRSEPGKLRVLLLAVTIITTFSSTGLIALALAIVARLLTSSAQSAPRRAGRRRVDVRFAIVAVLAIPMVILTLEIINGKLATSSGSVRLDDFRAGYKAWTNGNVLWGNGLSDTSAIASYMSSWRSYNAGFSNSLFEILVAGGASFLALIFVGMFGFFRLSQTSAKFFALVFSLVWIVTIVTFLPSTAFVLSMGVVGIIDKDSAERFITR